MNKDVNKTQRCIHIKGVFANRDVFPVWNLSKISIKENYNRDWTTRDWITLVLQLFLNIFMFLFSKTALLLKFRIFYTEMKYKTKVLINSTRIWREIEC